MKNLMFVLLILIGGTLSAMAQSNDDYSDSVIGITKADVREYFEKNMELTDANKEKFWSIYNLYVNELKPITEKNNQLLKELVENKSGNTEEEIDQKIITSLDLQERSIEIRTKYYRKIRSEINKNVASKFYQIDHYLSTYLSASLNEELPYYITK